MRNKTPLVTVRMDRKEFTTGYQEGVRNLSSNRRRFLQATGATVTMGALAGCTDMIIPDDGESEAGGEIDDPDDLPEVEATLGHSGPEDTGMHQHRAAVTFKDYIENQTDGQFTIDIVPGGGLGDLGEMTEQNIEGAVELVGSTAEGHLAPFYPNINVYASPFAFATGDEEEDIITANYVFDKEFGQRLWEDFRDQTGLRMLTWYDNGGFRNFGIAGEEVRDASDMEGLTIRTMEIEAHMELVRQLGASPEPMAWEELYEGIDQGVVDGQENSIPTVISGNLQEVIDWVITDGHCFTMNFIHCNDDWFQDLPLEYQSLVIEGGQMASLDARKVNRLQRMWGNDIVESEGVEIYEPDEDELDTFREATQEPVDEVIRDEMDDPDMLDEMMEAIDEARTELGFDDHAP
jgi:TRAP-type transport system periplasmic protein